MEIPALQTSHVKAADLPIEKLAVNEKVSERDKVAEVCRQFEAVLLRQILGEARKHIISSATNPDTAVNGIYNDMINNQLAESISRTGTFGLAKSLQAQLAHQVLRPADAAEPGSPPHGLKPLDETNQKH